MIKTSQSHPLRIDPVEIPGGRGRIGVTFAPGKTDFHAFNGPWRRDLAADLDVIVGWGATALVTLIEPHEFDLLAILGLGRETEARGLEWLHLPIRDVSIPDDQFNRVWRSISARLRARLEAGENIVVHCRGGLGRAGMITARLLVESGVDAGEAVRRVRRARPGAIETMAQEAWVKSGPAA